MTYMEELDFGAQGFKRAGDACPSAYSLCPSDLGGDCCPSTLSCGTSGCYTSSPPTACSLAGYVACGVQEGGGCCPSGFQCDRNGCIAPTGISVSIPPCDAGLHLCPASLNYGCCADGYSCGRTTCYATSTSTFPLTLTITSTNSASSVSTITTVVQTVYIPSTLMETGTSSSATVVSKIAASTTSGTADSTSTSSVGLSKSQRGGIIGGAIAGLLIVMSLALMAFVILRRFSRAASRASRSGNGSYDRPHNNNRQHTDNPLEPLVMHEVHSNTVHRPTAVHHNHSWTNYISPQISPPFYSSNAVGYTPLPASESDLQYQRNNQAYGYFDQNSGSISSNVSPPLDSRERSISFGQQNGQRRPSINSHGRNWSDVSNQSNQSNRSNESYELEALEADRRGSIQRAFAGFTDFRVTLSRKRSRRKSSLSTRGPTDTGDWAKSLQGTLDDVAEGQRSEEGNDEHNKAAMRNP